MSDKNKEAIRKWFMKCIPGYYGTYLDGGVCAVVLEQTDGKPIYRGYNGCHGFMSSYDFSSITHITTSLWCKDEKDGPAAALFWDYICDPKRSPWRVAIQGSEVLRDDEGRPIAIRVPITEDTPNQVLVNFFIATRNSYEKPDRIAMFKHGIDKGLKEHEAFLLYTFLQDLRHGTKNSEILEAAPGAHFPFHWTREISAWRIKEGKPTYDSRRMRLGHIGYSPSDAIWSPLPREKAINVSNTYVPHYTGNQWFDQREGSRLPITKDKIIKVLKGIDNSYKGIFPKRFLNDHGSSHFEGSSIYKLDDIVTYMKKHSEEIFRAP